MIYETLVDVATLASHRDREDWRVVDCRFSLREPEAGARAHAAATIPGAIYAHLDRDLSGAVTAGVTGRHPLPARAPFAATLGRWGVTAQTQVVAFDDQGGAFASRLWWMLRWFGHRAAAVLDGGLDAWTGEGHPLAPGGAPSSGTGSYPDGPSLVEWVSAQEVLDALEDPTQVLLDARAAARFRGEQEPTDPVAGHIPGARSMPFGDNLGPDGRFLPAATLAKRFEERLSGSEPARSVAYCGSGVTACHDVLAMAHAGMPMARLFVGSWSEWITDPSRPRATGAE